MWFTVTLVYNTNFSGSEYMLNTLYQNQGLGHYQKEGMYRNCIFSKFTLKNISYNKACSYKESKILHVVKEAK